MSILSGLSLTSMPKATANADQLVTIDGRGFGHGVGLAQDGAYWMGRSGRSATQIIQTFYPGTVLGRRGGAIRVPLASAGSVTLSFPAGGRVGKYSIPAGGSATIRARSGGLAVDVGNSGGGSATKSTGQASGKASGKPGRSSAGGTGLATVGLTSPLNPLLSRVLAAVGAPVPVGAPISPPPTALPIPVGAPTPTPPPAPAPVPAGPPITVEPAPTTTTPAGQPGVEPVAVVTVPVTPVPVSPSNPDPAANPAANPVPVVPAEGAPIPVTPETPTQTQSADGLLSDAPAPPAEPVSARIEATSGGLIGLGGRRFRGSIELQARGGAVRAVNIVDVEQYLRGMGEILYSNWPAATLQTQAIAARTYALRMMGSVGEVCPTQACQVYLGAQVEYPQMDAAVRATAGKVVMYKGKLAATFYSASGGGTIATPEEGFGKGAKDVPYLRAGIYVAGDLQSWTVSMRLGEIARRVGYRGLPSSVAITEVGPSGRATEITVYGSGGPMRVGGPRFDAALGLKSTLFTFRGSGVGIGTSAVVVPVTTPSGSGTPLGGLGDPTAAGIIASEAGSASNVGGTFPTVPSGGTFPTVPGGGTFPTVPSGGGTFPTVPSGGGTFPTAPPTSSKDPVTPEPPPASTPVDSFSNQPTIGSTTAATNESVAGQTLVSTLTTEDPSAIAQDGAAPGEGRPPAEPSAPPVTGAAPAVADGNQIEITTEPDNSNNKGFAVFAGVTVALLGAGTIRRVRQRSR